MCVLCAGSVEAVFVELSHAAEELGDIPDRFMCPIGCDIMRDPVILPTSGQVKKTPKGQTDVVGRGGLLRQARELNGECFAVCLFVRLFFFFSEYDDCASFVFFGMSGLPLLQLDGNASTKVCTAYCVRSMIGARWGWKTLARSEQCRDRGRGGGDLRLAPWSARPLHGVRGAAA